MEELTNKQRAEWAEQIIHLHPYDEADGDLDIALIDILMNLRHLCHQEGIDFAEAVEGSEIHFLFEIEW